MGRCCVCRFIWRSLEKDNQHVWLRVKNPDGAPLSVLTRTRLIIESRNLSQSHHYQWTESCDVFHDHNDVAVIVSETCFLLWSQLRCHVRSVQGPCPVVMIWPGVEIGMRMGNEIDGEIFECWWGYQNPAGTPCTYSIPDSHLATIPKFFKINLIECIGMLKNKYPLYFISPLMNFKLHHELVL